MANIGTFTADKDGFTGTLRTLTLNVKAKLVPNDKGDNEKAPDFRVQAASHDIGAAWRKTSEAGREYLSVTLDDPSFPATVYVPPDRRRGRHARPDLVAQQAAGGLTAASAPRPLGRGAKACMGSHGNAQPMTRMGGRPSVGISHNCFRVMRMPGRLISLSLAI